MQREQRKAADEDQAEERSERRIPIGERAAGIVAGAEREQDDADDARNREDGVAVVRRQDANRQHFDNQHARSRQEDDRVKEVAQDALRGSRPCRQRSGPGEARGVHRCVRLNLRQFHR